MLRLVAVITAAGLALSAPAEAAPKPATVKSLRAKVKRLRVQNRTLRNRLGNALARQEAIEGEREAATGALRAGLPEQVRALAAVGSIGQLWPAVLEPIRTAWPCGAALYQGNALWSLDVNLWDYRDEEEITCEP